MFKYLQHTPEYLCFVQNITKYIEERILTIAPVLPGDIINSFTFGTEDGVLTAITGGGSTMGVSLEGRYMLADQLLTIPQTFGLQEALDDKVDKILGSSLITNTEILRLASMTAIFTTALKTAYDNAVTNSHTHSNKAILDLVTESFTTALKTSYDGAVTNSHTHTNKATLDLITQAFTTALKTSYDLAVTNSHTHANKAVLDAITESFTTALLNKVNAIDQNVSAAEKAIWNGKANTASVITQEFTFSGSQSFTLSNTASNVFGVFVQGQNLIQEQFQINGGNSLQILDTLNTGDKVRVTYNYSIADTTTYSKVESNSTFLRKYGTRTVLVGTVIDWGTDTDTYTKTLTTNTILTDSNLPQGTNTKTIVLSIDGAFSLTVPAYWKHKGGIYSSTKSNQIVLQCVNGNAGSERVNYVINPDL